MDKTRWINFRRFEKKMDKYFEKKMDKKKPILIEEALSFLLWGCDFLWLIFTPSNHSFSENCNSILVIAWQAYHS